MNELISTLPLIVLLVGVTLSLSILIKPALERLGVPPLVGYLILGVLLRLIGLQLEFFSDELMSIYEFLASIGLITLLFRIGLESNCQELISQLRNASIIWIGNILVSGLFGYITAYLLLGLGTITSIIIGIAFTATSVGIPVSVWEEAKALHTPNGELLIDVAGLDDISGIVLMALLFAIVKTLSSNGANGDWLVILLKTSQIILLKLVGFGAFCVFFASYIEQRMTSFLSGFESPPNMMLIVAGMGLTIAALAGLLGFSVAIGAFFAGLIFSRDPQAVKIDVSFGSIYDLFTPFFFIGIGLNIDLNSLATAFSLGSILLIAAVFGKVIGTSGPALLTLGLNSSILLGLSMVPRAEITMVIMKQGLQLGEWAVPCEVFSATVNGYSISSNLPFHSDNSL